MAIQSKITRSANGKHCRIRIPGMCKGLHGVVWCHLPRSTCKGMGFKPPDFLGAYGCHACHDEVDRRTMVFDQEFVDRYFYEAMVESQLMLLELGLVSIEK